MAHLAKEVQTRDVTLDALRVQNGVLQRRLEEVLKAAEQQLATSELREQGRVKQVRRWMGCEVLLFACH